jgi:phosphonatase-like hydrolase
MIKMIVFDMAGTTVNENNIVYKTLQRAINERGFEVSLDQVMAEGAGKEKLQAIKSILAVYANNQDEKLAGEIYQSFLVQLENAYKTFDIQPHENAKELFEQLKIRNIRVVLNTGYNRETAESLLKKLGWEKGIEFDSLVTASDVQNNRPEPDMIQFAMREFEIRDPAEVVKVGDSAIDIEEGKNAGCALNIGITTGAHTHEQLRSAKPDYIIDNLMDLLPLLDKQNYQKEPFEFALPVD